MDSLDDALKKAIALHDAKKYGEAAAIYRDSLIKDPANVMVMHLLALIAMQMDQPKVVMALAEEGLRLQPNLAVLHQDKALALRRLGFKENALLSINRAIELEPKQADFYGTLGSIQRDLRQYDMAVASMRKAIALQPDEAKHYNNLGIILGRMGANEEALAVLSQYIALKPGSAEGYNNRANIHKILRCYQEALADYEKALSIAPDIFMGRANKGIAHLVLGDYAEGWKLFEHRMPNNMPPEGTRFDAAKRWKGETNKSATLILYNEQGFGDTVQFCRYVNMARPRVGRLIVQVQQSLIPLLQPTWPDLTLVSELDPLPPHDFQCPLMSLPTVFGTTTQTVPAAEGYLKAEADKAKTWKDKLPHDGKKRVGLVWAGNPEHMNDHWRSINLSQLAPLWNVPGVHFYSLQKGEAALKQLGDVPAAAPLTVLNEQLTDFAQTAALISNLDLLITVDTAPLHIAGAMGVPTYALLQFDPDWRWMAEGADTPWYKSVQLFRQSVFGQWDDVVENVSAALKAFAA